jgi:hypothetical protein
LLDSHRASLANPDGYNADWPLSARQVVGPAVLIHSVGKGTVLTFAGSPDFATASEHHIVEARKLFANAVRSCIRTRASASPRPPTSRRW